MLYLFSLSNFVRKKPARQKKIRRIFGQIKKRVCLHVKEEVVCRPVGFLVIGEGAGFLIGGFSLLTS